MSPEHFFEQSQDMVSLQTAKDMARMAFLQGKICEAIENGADAFSPSIISEARAWQAFYNAERERNSNVHPAFRGLINGIGELS